MKAKQLIVILMVALLGCDGTEGTTGTVSGRITYQGEPLTEGTIAFSSQSTAVVASAAIQSDGTYDLDFAGASQVPIGSYQVTVHPAPAPFNPSGPPPLVTDDPRIPKRYRDPASSPLKDVIVTETDQQHDFDLTDMRQRR